MIALQLRESQPVAPLSRWTKLGRRLRAGQKPIWILAPSNRRQGFPFVGVPVFGYRQTKGKRLATWQFGLEGGAPRLAEVEQAAGVLGIVLEDVDGLPGQTWQARSLGGTIRVVRGLAPAERLSTVLHELGHEVLRHVELRECLPMRLRECEAESVSYVVSRALGLPTKAADYLARSGVGGEDVVRLRRRIAAASRVVLFAILESRRVEARALAPVTCRRCGARRIDHRQACQCDSSRTTKRRRRPAGPRC